MTLRRNIDQATLALVRRADPLTGDRDDADAEAALRAVTARIDALGALPHRSDRRVRARPRVLAGGSLGLAGVGAALTLVLTSGAAAPPAFAVTREPDA